MRTPPRLPLGRTLRRAVVLVVVAALGALGAGCSNDDNGGVIDGGSSGTAPLRPGATYGPTTTSSIAP